MTCDDDGVLAEELLALSEHDLQSLVVEPLLRKMGFDSVYDTSGPREQGKDLIAFKGNEFGQRVLYAIQLKRFRPSGRHDSSDSFGKLLDQLKSAVLEPKLDPVDNVSRRPSACIFITPYVISPTLREDFAERYRDPVFRMVTIVDGPTLVELVKKHLAVFASRSSSDAQYRRRLADDLNRVPESLLAFELGQELLLDRVYVQVSLAPCHFDRSMGFGALSNKAVWVSATKAELRQANKLYSTWDEGRKATLPTRAGDNATSLTPINLTPLYRAMGDALADFSDDVLPSLADPKATENTCSAVAKAAIELRESLMAARQSRLVRDHWQEAFDTSIGASPIPLCNLPQFSPS